MPRVCGTTPGLCARQKKRAGSVPTVVWPAARAARAHLSRGARGAARPAVAAGREGFVGAVARMVARPACGGAQRVADQCMRTWQTRRPAKDIPNSGTVGKCHMSAPPHPWSRPRRVFIDMYAWVTNCRNCTRILRGTSPAPLTRRRLPCTTTATPRWILIGPLPDPMPRWRRAFCRRRTAAQLEGHVPPPARPAREALACMPPTP